MKKIIHFFNFIIAMKEYHVIDLLLFKLHCSLIFLCFLNMNKPESKSSSEISDQKIV